MVSNVPPYAMYTHPETRKVVGNVFPIVGVLLLIGAIFAAVTTDRFIRSATRAEGEVIRLNAGGAHPEIRFVPPGEAPVQFSGQGFIKYAVGDAVTVLYRKDSQSPPGYQTQIDTPGALWASAGMLTWLGVSLVIGGWYTKSTVK
jgi:hypothetical protein